MLPHLVMVYYRLPYILYRDFPDFGYLTDNRNFGYDTACKSCVKVGDRILSKSGSIFYSVLTDKPQSEKEIAHSLLRIFGGCDPLEVETDVREFFQELVEDGFVGCGKAESLRPSYFSYANKTPIILQEENEVSGSEDDFFKCWGEHYHLSRVHLEVSAACNERCVHCYFPNSYRKGTMSRELFLTILEQCKSSNVLSLTMSGGEPMLNQDLLFFIRECRKSNFSINLLSNLTLLSDEMIREFVKTPLLSVQTSLYSMDPDVHDSITTISGSFKRTLNAIEVLHRHNIPMQINCPIMKQNIDSYQGVLNWAKSMNIEADSDYQLFGSFDRSRGNLKCRINLSELDSFIDVSSGLRAEDSHNRSFGRSDYTICPVCVSSLCVSHEGNVYPCEGWQSYILGNIKENSLTDIWNNSVDVKRLRSLSYTDFPKCQVCDNKEFCSICLIRNANESSSGDFREPVPFYCEVAKRKKESAGKLIH